MSVGFGGAVKLTGESEYRKALAEINKQLKQTSADMKLLTASYASNDKSIESLTAKEEALSKQYDEQAKKVKTLSERQKEVAGQYEKNKEAHNTLLATLSQEIEKLKEVEAESGKTSKEYQEQAKKVTDLTGQVKTSAATIETQENALSKLKVELTNATAEMVKTKKEGEALQKSQSSLTETINRQESELSDLKKAYIDAVAQYGKNSDEAKALGKSITDLSEELNDNKEEYENASKAADKLDKSIDESGKSAEKAASGGFTVLKGALASLAADAIKNVVSGLADLGKELVNLGKEAISSYADYEQLKGGIETLFGTGGKTAEEYAEEVGISVEQAELYLANSVRAQERVLEDARNAYKDVGLSANEYMETVTSFSASLLSSLGGNQEVAAKAANDALKDMSDNANKMGSDLQSIQAAYQGFAKGQFQLLDNLKLGYGGTKGEMERLLKDAQKLSGVKYNIDNLNDIYSAIHVIQEEMGITGTTANEAATTVSGSINMTKKAWENLVTGLADDNADLSGLINNFVESLNSTLDNILPLVDNVVSGILTLGESLVTNLLPQLLNRIPPLVNQLAPVLLSGVTQILKSISSVLPQLLPTIQKLITDTLGVLTRALPELLKTGSSLLLSIIQGIAEAIPDLIKMLPDVIKAITDTLLSEEGINTMIDTGIDLLVGVIDGLTEAIPKLVAMLPQIIETICSTLTEPEMIGKILVTAADLVIELSKGIINTLGEITSAAGDIISSFISGIRSWFEKIGSLGGDLLMKLKEGIDKLQYKVIAAAMTIGQSIIDALPIPDDLKEVGEGIVRGIWEGVQSLASWLKEKCRKFASGIVSGIKGALGIASPSKVFRDQVGRYIAEGIGVGFTDEMKDVTKEMQDAIPSSFDIEPKVNSGLSYSGTGLGGLSYTDVVNAFKEALADVKVEMDDVTMGKFVEQTVTDAIYT